MGLEVISFEISQELIKQILFCIVNGKKNVKFSVKDLLNKNDFFLYDLSILHNSSNYFNFQSYFEISEIYLKCVYDDFFRHLRSSFYGMTTNDFYKNGEINECDRTIFIIKQFYHNNKYNEKTTLTEKEFIESFVNIWTQLIKYYDLIFDKKIYDEYVKKILSVDVDLFINSVSVKFPSLNMRDLNFLYDIFIDIKYNYNFSSYSIISYYDVYSEKNLKILHEKINTKSYLSDEIKLFLIEKFNEMFNKFSDKEISALFKLTPAIYNHEMIDQENLCSDVINNFNKCFLF